MSTEKLAIEGGTPVRTTPLPSVGNKSGRDMGREEIANLTEVINSGSLFRYGGKFVDQFEKVFAEMLGVRHGIASTSGTAAIHIAVASINPNPGDEIITSPITDMGTLIGILFQNAIPVFADLDPETYTLLPESVEACITSKTKAIIPVHLFGQMCDMDPILEIAKKHGLKVIEDCCQAYLAEYKGHLAGTMGDIGCFSLQQSKHMTAGDGGITITNDDNLANRARLFMDKGWPREPGARDYMFLGINYRMNELSGAVACAQVEKVKDIVERRRKVAEGITQLIVDAPGVNPPVVREGCKHSWWLYPFTINEKILNVTPQEFCKALTAEGVPAGVGYIGKPIYMSPVFQERMTYGTSGCPFTCPNANPRQYREEDCPNTVEILRSIITMGCNEFFSEQDIQDVGHAINKVARYYAGRKS
ncbi:MAG: DegT/DnrJ/EryC1/StrS family aminotransferase [Armatimonadota bacterium]|nr:DegT/DnrJ/EryC1/StrS family aminotransferase [Armatimonadota bacterium]